MSSAVSRWDCMCACLCAVCAGTCVCARVVVRVWVLSLSVLTLRSTRRSSCCEEGVGALVFVVEVEAASAGRGGGGSMGEGDQDPGGGGGGNGSNGVGAVTASPRLPIFWGFWGLVTGTRGSACGYDAATEAKCVCPSRGGREVPYCRTGRSFRVGVCCYSFLTMTNRMREGV